MAKHYGFIIYENLIDFVVSFFSVVGHKHTSLDKHTKLDEHTGLYKYTSLLQNFYKSVIFYSTAPRR